MNNSTFSESRQSLELKELQIDLNNNQTESINGSGGLKLLGDFINTTYDKIQERSPILPDLSFYSKGVDWLFDKTELDYDGPINKM